MANKLASRIFNRHITLFCLTTLVSCPYSFHTYPMIFAASSTANGKLIMCIKSYHNSDSQPPKFNNCSDLPLPVSSTAFKDELHPLPTDGHTKVRSILLSPKFPILQEQDKAIAPAAIMKAWPDDVVCVLLICLTP